MCIRDSLTSPPQERGKGRGRPNVEGARRVDGRRVPKDATHSIGNDVISGGAVNNVDGVSLQAFHPLAHLVIVQLTVAPKEPHKRGVVDVSG